MSDILSTPGWLYIYISTIKPKDMLRFTQPMQLTFIIINASLTYHKSPWLVKSPIFVGRRCALSFGTCFGQVQAERALAPRATGRSQDRRVESCLFGKWLYNIWRDVYIYDVYTWLYMYIQGNYAYTGVYYKSQLSSTAKLLIANEVRRGGLGVVVSKRTILRHFPT